VASPTVAIIVTREREDEVSHRPETARPRDAGHGTGDQLPLLGFPLAAPNAAPEPEPVQAAAPTAAPAAEAAPRSFQSASSLQGRQFADQCDTLLAGSGFRLGGRVNVAQVGIEIDQEAVAPSGQTIWFEYKGSLQGHRPGLLRTDTLKKAIANGALLGAVEGHPPFVVLTSHVPEAGSGLAMLDAAKALGFVHDVICVYRPGDAARLRAL
jgi:hypothetical protein